MDSVKEKLYQNVSLGQMGRKFQIGAGTVTPDTGKVFIAIQALEFSVVTLADVTALELDAGTIIYGRDASVVVTSGGIVAYQGV